MAGAAQLKGLHHLFVEIQMEQPVEGDEARNEYYKREYFIHMCIFRDNRFMSQDVYYNDCRVSMCRFSLE